MNETPGAVVFQLPSPSSSSSSASPPSFTSSVECNDYFLKADGIFYDRLPKCALPRIVTSGDFNFLAMTPFGQRLHLQNDTLKGGRGGARFVVHIDTTQDEIHLMSMIHRCKPICNIEGRYLHDH